MTGFNNRWDHEGETADESREREERGGSAATHMHWRRDARCTQSESDKPCKGEKREMQ